jgi:hypothetical protein
VASAGARPSIGANDGPTREFTVEKIIELSGVDLETVACGEENYYARGADGTPSRPSSRADRTAGSEDPAPSPEPDRRHHRGCDQTGRAVTPHADERARTTQAAASRNPVRKPDREALRQAVTIQNKWLDQQARRATLRLRKCHPGR